MRNIRLVMLMVLPCLTGCLNPDLVSRSVGGLYPTAPGNEQFVLVRLINQTTATLDVPIVYDDGSQPAFTYFVRGLSPGGKDTGLLLDWPIVRVAIGDLDNPFQPAVNALFPDGRSVAVAFGNPALQAGVDFNRGDTILFVFTEDSRSSAYIRVSPALISGTSQTGPFSRGDPFERLQILLQASGF
jgi:hypothetical protein